MDIEVRSPLSSSTSSSSPRADPPPARAGLLTPRPGPLHHAHHGRRAPPSSSSRRHVLHLLLSPAVFRLALALAPLDALPPTAFTASPHTPCDRLGAAAGSPTFDLEAPSPTLCVDKMRLRCTSSAPRARRAPLRDGQVVRPLMPGAPSGGREQQHGGSERRWRRHHKRRGRRQGASACVARVERRRNTRARCRRRRSSGASTTSSRRTPSSSSRSPFRRPSERGPALDRSTRSSRPLLDADRSPIPHRPPLVAPLAPSRELDEPRPAARSGDARLEPPNAVDDVQRAHHRARARRRDRGAAGPSAHGSGARRGGRRRRRLPQSRRARARRPRGRRSRARSSSARRARCRPATSTLGPSALSRSSTAPMRPPPYVFPPDDRPYARTHTPITSCPCASSSSISYSPQSSTLLHPVLTSPTSSGVPSALTRPFARRPVRSRNGTLRTSRNELRVNGGPRRTPAQGALVSRGNEARARRPASA